ncbi:hypothetical protein [Paenibacillus chitinolyticus]|uniref:Uncharacterized protein n=1 Tax=Paenibacillus chitinolyticus TaxID=79263 RepID=A0ABT4FBE0_9BACL|nr:hypothetical protein [Paenibacillus chitinolyticus]MCY9593045.1 hypothetical protein [Paenibacillus chitinolyticus]MCY9595221.1 hypothetical protein [Paenibacillus chitinolyticus]
MEIFQQVKENDVLITGGNYLKKKTRFVIFSFSMVVALVLLLPTKTFAESSKVKIEDSALKKSLEMNSIKMKAQ